MDNNEYISELKKLEGNEVDKNEPKNELSTSNELSSDKIIKEQEQLNLEAIKGSDDFKKASSEVTARKVANDLKKQANEIQDEELNRQLEEYKLKKKKEELDLRAKKEKELISQQVKAEVYDQKRKIAEKRYGYLYQTTEIEMLNEKGERTSRTIYKDFTPSKSINRAKEFSSWYKNLSNETQKFINTTCKFFLKLGGWVAIGGAIYGIVKWLLNSGLPI